MLIYIPCVKYTSEAAVQHRGLSLVLCDERWEGEYGGEREAQEEGDICILIAESCCCTAETNTTL